MICACLEVGCVADLQAPPVARIVDVPEALAVLIYLRQPTPLGEVRQDRV